MTETKNKYNSNKNLMIYKNQIGNKETKKNPESGATNTQSTFSLKKTMKK
jgi:hypothetical protein